MKLGVFITTHFNDSGTGNYRHGEGFAERVQDSYHCMLNKYNEFDPGVDTDVCVVDTESNLKEFTDWISTVEYVTHKVIPNVGGVFASVKHIMHGEPEIMEQYDYFFFHTDDSVYVHGDNWAKEAIEEYNAAKNLGIMGRELSSIDLGPQGLVEHRNVCPHIAEMWNITKITTIPHLHADWWFMSKDTLRLLSEVWYSPIESIKAMQYQRMLENTDYRSLALMGDSRQALDNFHIGRETDTVLRVEYAGLQCKGYEGDKIIWDK